MNAPECISNTLAFPSSKNLKADQALNIYQQSKDMDYASQLFHYARTLRDQHIGTTPWWSAGISAVTACELEQLCTYCNFFTKRTAKIQDVVAAAKEISNQGIRHLHLSGGSRVVDADGDDRGLTDYLLELIAAIKAETDIEIEVNVGPSLNRQGVQALKQAGVAAITSSLEMLNPIKFKEYKPSDSLKDRIRLMEICEEERVPIRSMMLIGLNDTDEDRIEHLMFLRQFSMLKHLRFSRFMPQPGTQAQGVRCSPWPVARLIAVARLLFPSADLGLAAGNTPDDLPLWWQAGGGNQILGASVSMKDPRSKNRSEAVSTTVAERVVVHNNMAQVRRYLTDLGLTPTFHH